MVHIFETPAVVFDVAIAVALSSGERWVRLLRQVWISVAGYSFWLPLKLVEAVYTGIGECESSVKRCAGGTE